jgi:large subunit ribosomal protein L6e
MVSKPKTAAAEPVRGIGATGRSKTYHRRGLWAIKQKNGGKFPTHAKQEQAAEAPAKEARLYPADDVSVPKKRQNVLRPTKLRASITPGTVLILLAGRFKGKRVVFLRQLPSGLLLVTGPFKLNGVPLRRVNAAYVIATSTKVDVGSVDATKFGDAYFKPTEKKEKKKGEKEFFQAEGGDAKKTLAPEYLENQKTIDGALLGGLSDDLKGYLSTRFGLKSGDRPHLMKF